MKSLFFALVLTCLALAANAQHETIFNNARVVGGFGAPIVEMGLGNEMTTAVGGGGAIVIDNFFVGGYGVGRI